jgi:hypothetical protein
MKSCSKTFLLFKEHGLLKNFILFFILLTGPGASPSDTAAILLLATHPSWLTNDSVAFSPPHQTTNHRSSYSPV